MSALGNLKDKSVSGNSSDSKVWHVIEQALKNCSIYDYCKHGIYILATESGVYTPAANRMVIGCINPKDVECIAIDIQDYVNTAGLRVSVEILDGAVELTVGGHYKAIVTIRKEDNRWYNLAHYDTRVCSIEACIWELFDYLFATEDEDSDLLKLVGECYRNHSVDINVARDNWSLISRPSKDSFRAFVSSVIMRSYVKGSAYSGNNLDVIDAVTLLAALTYEEVN